MLETKKPVSVIWYYAKMFWKQELFCILLILLLVGISLINPLLIRYLIDDILPGQSVKMIIYFVLGYIFLNVILKIVAFSSAYMISKVENSIITDIRAKMYQNMIFQPLDFHRNNSIGPVVQKILGDVEAIRSLWGFLFPTSISSILMFVFTFGIITKFDWKISLFSLITIFVYIIIFRVYNEKIRELYLKVRSTSDRVNSFINETWSGIKEIKIFQIENSQIQKYGNFLQDLFTSHLSMKLKKSMSTQLLDFSSLLGTLVVLGIGGYYVMKGKMTVGTLMALNIYISRMYEPSKDIADMAMDFKKYSVSVSRFSEILLLDDAESYPEVVELPKLNGDVTFNDVYFQYDQNQVLKGISFDLSQGEVIALAGKSGVGKSTIINLILGFIQPLAGSIKIDGKEITDIPLHVLRSNVALVSQDIYLFNLSVYDNIKLGNLNATKDQIMQVVKKLNIESFTGHLPDGVHSIISENGKNLSGGQIQRIAIARALLKDAPILIFDEATSAIDSETERVIHTIIHQLKSQKTIILISHRLSSLKEADQILVIDQGKIVERGQRDYLVQHGDYFNQLFHEQLA